jgi:hypothetical protein
MGKIVNTDSSIKKRMWVKNGMSNIIPFFSILLLLVHEIKSVPILNITGQTKLNFVYVLCFKSC